MFIIDFDDTLLDTQAYKEARIAVLEKLGVARAVYEKTYQQVYYSYTHERHAQALAERGFSYEVMLKTLNECLEKVGRFVFADAKEFLDSLKKYQQPMMLLSFGVKEIQEFKLKAVGFQNYFDRVYTTVGTKEEVLDKLDIVERTDVWFINDKVGETLKIKENFPLLKIVLKQCPAYPEDDYRKSSLPYFKTLAEIKDYVKRHY